MLWKGKPRYVESLQELVLWKEVEMGLPLHMLPLCCHVPPSGWVPGLVSLADPQLPVMLLYGSHGLLQHHSSLCATEHPFANHQSPHFLNRR